MSYGVFDFVMCMLKQVTQFWFNCRVAYSHIKIVAKV